MKLLLVTCAALLCAACSTGSVVVMHDTTGFDASCSVADDCSLVFVGDVCGCSCQIDSVNSNAFSDYQDSWFDAQNECLELLSCPSACEQPILSCDAGTCTVF